MLLSDCSFTCRRSQSVLLYNFWFPLSALSSMLPWWLVVGLSWAVLVRRDALIFRTMFRWIEALPFEFIFMWDLRVFLDKEPCLVRMWIQKQLVVVTPPNLSAEQEVCCCCAHVFCAAPAALTHRLPLFLLYSGREAVQEVWWDPAQPSHRCTLLLLILIQAPPPQTLCPHLLCFGWFFFFF